MNDVTIELLTKKNQFEFYSGNREIRFFRLGRHALLASFRIINVRSFDKILVPAFICRDLLAAIHDLGATPIFYDVSPNLKPIKLPDITNVCAVLAVNYFGFAQDLLPFRVYCERNGATLIEDNAHGFLSCDETGVELGTRGDLGVFSIRKTFTLPDGAMLIVNNGVLRKSLESQLAYCTHRLPISFWVKRVLSMMQRSTGVAWISIGTVIARRFRYWRTGYEIAPLLPENEFVMPENPSPHFYSISALSSLNCLQEVSRRRNLYMEFSNIFAILKK